MLKLRVPFQLSEVQFNVYFTDCLTQRWCCEESQVESVSKDLVRRGATSPALPAAAGCPGD